MNTSKEYRKTLILISNLGIRGVGDLRICNEYGHDYWMVLNLKFPKQLPHEKELELIITTQFNGKFKGIAKYYEQDNWIFRHGKLEKIVRED